ncbi:glycosyltransferase family 4 protein [Psychrobacter pygoscelis]|uniref:glycosyltransferase family 4 protein n=1 Tax=Psychrobacter pygoscelis TaxID=2488563 RepID=UPI00103FE5F7|nr:glycosyltransferase family 4 protein [Psychrobacter pygoscelis]
MKFLLIASYPPSFLSFRGELLAALARTDLEIHLAAPDFVNHPEAFNQLKTLGYQLHEIPMQRTGTNPIADMRAMLSLYRLMKSIKPDYVLAYTIKPVIYGLLAAKLAHVPHQFALITGLGYAFQGAEEQGYKKSNLQKLMHQLYSRALASAQKVFFQNPDDEALFRTMGIIKPEVATKIVNGSGVDIAEYSVVSLPTKNHVPEPRFLLIARLLEDKGIREYAQAAKIIKAKYPGTQFDLVGWIDDNPNSISQSELDDWINERVFNFWGKVADVRPAISASSVYVLPSYREGTPRTVLEAMAMGRAVITTDAPGCRETVTDGLNGYLVPVKAVDELAAAMETFIFNPELLTQMGTASRQLVEEKFDVHTVNRAMLEAMEIL